MTERKFLLVSLEDERAKHLADVLGNKTCNKIIDNKIKGKTSLSLDYKNFKEAWLSSIWARTCNSTCFRPSTCYSRRFG